MRAGQWQLPMEQTSPQYYLGDISKALSPKLRGYGPMTTLVTSKFIVEEILYFRAPKVS